MAAVGEGWAGATVGATAAAVGAAGATVGATAAVVGAMVAPESVGVLAEPSSDEDEHATAEKATTIADRTTTRSMTIVYNKPGRGWHPVQT